MIDQDMETKLLKIILLYIIEFYYI